MKNQKRIAALVREIRAFCADNGNEQQIAKYARYFREGYDAYGVPDELMRPKREEWFAANQDLGLAGFLDLGDLLLANGKYEEASTAIVNVARFRDDFDPALLERIAGWLDTGVRNWAHCDILCGELLSHLLVKDIIPLEALADWRGAESRWRRRAVPVSMLGLLKQPHKTTALLEFVTPMMADSERVVHQGLGWFLREAWKKNQAPVEKFLLHWKDTAARLVFQYATEKMTPKQKERFRAKPRRR